MTWHRGKDEMYYSVKQFLKADEEILFYPPKKSPAALFILYLILLCTIFMLIYLSGGPSDFFLKNLCFIISVFAALSFSHILIPLYIGSDIILTDKRLIYKSGISRRVYFIPYSKIEHSTGGGELKGNFIRLYCKERFELLFGKTIFLFNVSSDYRAHLSALILRMKGAGDRGEEKENGKIGKRWLYSPIELFMDMILVYFSIQAFKFFYL